jgi:hypothetical protein
VYDEYFSTVSNPGVDLDEFSPTTWANLIQTGHSNSLEPEDPAVREEVVPFAEWFDEFIRTNSRSVRANLDSEGENGEFELNDFEFSPDSTGHEGVVVVVKSPPVPSRGRDRKPHSQSHEATSQTSRCT